MKRCDELLTLFSYEKYTNSETLLKKTLPYMGKKDVFATKRETSAYTSVALQLHGSAGCDWSNTHLVDEASW